jgi:hypothetical protein
MNTCLCENHARENLCQSNLPEIPNIIVCFSDVHFVSSSVETFVLDTPLKQLNKYLDLKWVPEVKRPGREADHSSAASAEVRPHAPSWRSA